jgi:signal transduction histidine kinase
MLKSPLPEHLRKDWLLHFSGFITWSVICYLSLVNLDFGQTFVLKFLAFIIFYLSFAWIIFSDKRAESKVNKLLLVVEVVTVLLLISSDTYNVAAILLVLIATQLPSMFTRKKALLLMFLITVAHFSIVYNGSFISGFFQVIIYFMLQVFGFSAIETILREAKAKEELAAINQELLATRFMLKASSQKQERLRISRDLHDAIGHQLTALSLNLEVAKHKVSEEFKPLLQENLQLAKTLLSNVRQVISSPDINSLQLRQQLMFCLQEGVSNALRHGKANLFTLACEKMSNSLVINLYDNGTVTTKNNENFGSGLAGMNERLIDFSGKVALITNESGCTLKIQVEDCYD